MARSPLREIAFLIAGLAGASLLLSWDPVFDPWGWLVWGREVAALELDTSSGPSWKPLPVLFTTPFSLFGEGAPELWLLVARAGWLAAVALAGLLASRLAERAGAGRRERIAAAVIAAVGIVLLFDSLTPWLRQFAGGLSEPLLVCLVLAAVERSFAGRERQALALASAAALIRPEVWPFLLAYGWWLWRQRPESGTWYRRYKVPLALAVVGILWFVPDLLGSGSFLTGADRAREGSGSPLVEALEVLLRAAELPLAALWAGLAFAAVAAWRRSDRAVVALVAGALAWVALVAVMASAGYAGLPRFLAPVAAIVCALGAVGLARLFTGVRPLVAAVALALLLVVQVGVRVVELADDAATATRISEARGELERIVDDVGAERIRGCGVVVVGAIEGQTALAWSLDVPISDVEVSKSPPTRGFFLERTDDGWLADAGGCPAIDGSAES